MAKRDEVIKIVGRIVNHAKGEVVARLRVEAWDKDLVCKDLIGSAVTDAGGTFQIEFGKCYLQKLLLDRRPELFFKIFRGESWSRAPRIRSCGTLRPERLKAIVNLYYRF